MPTTRTTPTTDSPSSSAHRGGLGGRPSEAGAIKAPASPALEAPSCSCHDVRMNWHTDRRKRRGGYWECAVRRQETNARYGKSENGRTAKARANARHQQTEKCRITKARNNARIVKGASGYLGMAPTAEQAEQLKQMARDFRAEQKRRAAEEES